MVYSSIMYSSYCKINPFRLIQDLIYLNLLHTTEEFLSVFRKKNMNYFVSLLVHTYCRFGISEEQMMSRTRMFENNSFHPHLEFREISENRSQ